MSCLMKTHEYREISYIISSLISANELHNRVCGNISNLYNKNSNIISTELSFDKSNDRLIPKLNLKALPSIFKNVLCDLLGDNFLIDTFNFKIIKELSIDTYTNNENKKKTQMLYVSTLEYCGTIMLSSKDLTINRSLKEFNNLNEESISKLFERDLMKILSDYDFKISNIGKDEIKGCLDLILPAGIGGVFVHEAVGHCLEADYLFERKSILCDKVGEKVAEEVLNVSDIPFEGVKYSSDGSLSKPVQLIQEGKIINYLSDKFTSRVYNIKDTGNGRGDRFDSLTYPRMRNIYIHNGTMKRSDIIRKTDLGILATDIGGANVVTETGEFVFNIEKGVLILRGEKCGFVSNILFSGNVLSALKQIDCIANDLSFYGATCSKHGQIVPVIYGQPTIRLKGGIIVSE